jgi:hypothetical protein
MSVTTMLLSDAVVKDNHGDLGAQEEQANQCSIQAMSSGDVNDHVKAARLKHRIADKLRSAAERTGPKTKKMMLRAMKHQQDADFHQKLAKKK